MNTHKSIRSIVLVALLVGSSYYHVSTTPDSKSYEVTVLDKWETESCSKQSCHAKYVIKYKVNETGYESKMIVLKKDYEGFSQGSVASYKLSVEDAYDLSASYYIKTFLSFVILVFFALFLVALSIGYITVIFGSIIDWEFDIDNFKFWNWSL